MAGIAYDMNDNGWIARKCTKTKNNNDDQRHRPYKEQNIKYRHTRKKKRKINRISFGIYTNYGQRKEARKKNSICTCMASRKSTKYEEGLYVHIFDPLNKVEDIFFWPLLRTESKKYAISRMVIYCYCAAFNSIEGAVDRSLNFVFILYLNWYIQHHRKKNGRLIDSNWR